MLQNGKCKGKENTKSTKSTQKSTEIMESTKSLESSEDREGGRGSKYDTDYTDDPVEDVRIPVMTHLHSLPKSGLSGSVTDTYRKYTTVVKKTVHTKSIWSI